jgi:lipoprotein NlpI
MIKLKFIIKILVFSTFFAFFSCNNENEEIKNKSELVKPKKQKAVDKRKLLKDLDLVISANPNDAELINDRGVLKSDLGLIVMLFLILTKL